MKIKTKAIMAFLTAMTMTAGAMSVTAYAEEELIDASSPDVLYVDISHPEKYKNLSGRALAAVEWYKHEEPFANGSNDLHQYFRENGLYKKGILVKSETDKYGSEFAKNHIVKVVYTYTNTEVREAVEKFLKDRNDAGEWVEFCPVGEHDEPQEEITDIYEIAALINDFIRDPANDITGSMDTKVWVQVRDIRNNDYLKIQVKTQEDKEKIEEYMDKMHLKVVHPDRLTDEEPAIEWSVKYTAQQPEDQTYQADVQKTYGSADLGDANDDGKTNVRDCAFIATALASGKAAALPDKADYNRDGKINVRDAASISSDLAAK